MEKIFEPVIAAAMKTIDVDALAKKVGPKLMAVLEREAVKYMENEFDWGDLISDVLYDKDVQKSIKERMKSAFKV